MTIGDRIKKRREELGLSQEELAKKLNYKSRSTINKIEMGINDVTQSKVVAFAKALDTTPAYLMGWEKEQPTRTLPPNFEPLPKMKKVPLIGTIACGTPILATQNVERKILLPDGVRADFALRCQGDSMINAGIDVGDIVFIRQQPRVENGEIAAVQITDFETEATLKRVYVANNSVTLVAENPAYPPMTFVNEEVLKVSIAGKCVAVLKDLEE